MLTFKVLRNGTVKLIGSCEVLKRNFEKEINDVKEAVPDLPVWNRSMKSLRREWAAHNLAYKLGVRRSKTHDVDFDYPQTWLSKLSYWVIGGIAMLFIK